MTKPKPTLSVDLGNSFTKLSTRPKWHNPAVQSTLWQHPSLNFDGNLNLCIPTLAARHRREERWLFGADVYDLPRPSPDWIVLANWKRALFGDHSSNLPSSRTPAAFQLSREERAELMEGFFAYLLDLVCTDLEEDLSCYRVRVALPEFSLRSRGQRELHEAMERSGWPRTSAIDFVSEPLANAVGVLTQGLNVLFPGGDEPTPNIQEMLSDGPLVEKSYRPGYQHPGAHWCLVADVGAYTVDFALLGFDPCNLQHDLDGWTDGKRRLVVESQPTGISHLLDEIAALLPQQKQELLDLILYEEGDGAALFFNRILEGSYFEDEVTFDTLGDAAEGDLIRQCIHQFAQRIAITIQEFLEANPRETLHELILTGGGMNLQPIREAAIAAARSQSSTLHVSAPERQNAGSRIGEDHHTLDRALVRGATALGGASIFFDALAIPDYPLV